MTHPLPPRVCPSCGCRHLFVARRRWPWRRRATWRCYGCFAVVDPTQPTNTPETNMTDSRTWTGPVNPCTNGKSFCGQHGYRCPDEEPSRLSLYRKIVGAPPPPADWTCPADEDS